MHTLEHGQRARRTASEVENVSCGEELALFGLRKTQGTESFHRKCVAPGEFVVLREGRDSFVLRSGKPGAGVLAIL